MDIHDFLLRLAAAALGAQLAAVFGRRTGRSSDATRQRGESGVSTQRKAGGSDSFQYALLFKRLTWRILCGMLGS